MRRTTALIGAGTAAVMVFAGCSAGEGTDLGGASDALVAAIAGEPDQLDPHMTTSYFSFQVLENVYDTLVEPDENLEMQPALAQSWELSDDQLTWTFQLRDNVTFHDGSPFTADDVLYSYNRIIDEELSNAWRLSAIEEIVAPDDHTVEVQVSQPSPNLLSNLGGFKGLAIVQQDNVDSGDITTHPIGTGPFSVDEYRSGDSIVLVANENHWAGKPDIPGVTFRFISEGSTAVAALKSGEVDWTDSIPTQQVEGLAAETETLTLGQTPSNDYWYLALNHNKQPWDDVRVRQAVAYAVDRDAIVQATTYGTATANQLAIPEQSVWYHEYNPYSTDLDAAQTLLDQAGITDVTLDLLVSSEYPETVTAAQIIADNLEPLGITVEIRSPDFATWLDEQNTGNFDMLMMGWLGNIDPDDFYYAQHHSDGANNAQGYANSDVDDLLDQARTETETDTRKKLYADLATIVADEASYIYLYNPSVIQAWVPGLDYEVRGDRAVRFRDASFGG
ncbi:MAG TPA: hypothetical protein H9881_19125 [Candidatus Stackebrandtia excrementipullorum]|nr:hypothetical protein [Candidatus Stackebrandtia excrementipullorum]